MKTPISFPSFPSLRSASNPLGSACLLLLAIVLLALPAWAGTLSWSGGGSSGNWSDAGNWGFAGTPASGDTLVFPAAQPRLTNTNNLAGLVLAGIRFAGPGGGYTLYGNAFTLTNQVVATNTAGANTINNSITLSVANITVEVASGISLALNGQVSGTVGVTKTGAGTLTYGGSASNPYSGTTRVNAGTLQLNVGGLVACNGPLVIGDGSGVGSPTVRLLQSFELPDAQPITLNLGGLLDLNDFSDTISTSLTFNNSSIVQSGSGILTLPANAIVAVNAGSSTISGNFNVGSGTCLFGGSGNLTISAMVTGAATLAKSGTGYLYLTGANGYSGSTLVQQGILWVQNSLGLGATNNGVVVSNSASLVISGGIAITNKSLTLNGPGVSGFWGALDAENAGTNIWAGPITLNADSTIAPYAATTHLRLIGPISGAGGVEKFANSGGTLYLEGNTANTYAGLTKIVAGTNVLVKVGVGDGAIPHNLQIGDGVNAATVRYASPNQIPNSSIITLNDDCVLDLNNQYDGIGGLEIHGAKVIMGTGFLDIYSPGTITSYSSTNAPAEIYGKLGLMAPTTLKTDTTVPSAAFEYQLQVHASIYGSQPLTVARVGPIPVATLLVASNSFTGPVIVSSGALMAENDYALGATSSGTIVSNGAAIALWGTVHIGNEPLTLYGYLQAGLFTNSWAGPVTFATNAFIHVGNTTNTGLILTGALGGPGGFTKVGPGALTLSGPGANTYAGRTVVSAGLLKLQGGSPTVPGALDIGVPLGEVNSAIVRLGASEQIANNAPVGLFMSGQFDLASYNETIGPLTCASEDTTSFLGGNIIGTGTLTLTDNATNQGWGDVSINCPLSLGGQTRRFECEWGGFDLYGRVSDGGSSAGIVKNGPWALNLFAANTYSGPTTTRWGEIGVFNNQSLGSTANGTFIADYGSLRLYDVDVTGESLTCSNAQVSYVGLNSWNGPVALASDTYFASSVIGPIGGEQLVLNTSVSGPGVLMINGAGEVKLTGLTPNTYTGATRAVGGRLRLSKPAGVIAVPGRLEIGEENDHYHAQVVLDADNQISASAPVSINNSGLLDLNDFSNTLGPLTFTSGHLSTGTGTAFLNGNVVVNLHTNKALIDGKINLPATRTFDIAPGGYYVDLLVNASVSGPGGITKQGLGDMQLHASNSYAGLTLISAGAVALADSFGLGATSSGTVISDGGQLFLLGGAKVGLESLTLSGSGHYNEGALISAQGSNSWAGPVTLAGDTAVSVSGANAFLNLAGPINGTGNLTNMDVSLVYLNETSGTLMLSGAAPNTFSGDVYSPAGTLLLNKTAYNGAIPHGLSIGGTVGLLTANQIDDFANVRISVGGLLDLGTAWDFFDTLQGTGTVNFGNGGFLGVGVNGGSSQFDGPMTGVGYAGGWTLAKYGGGTFTVTGNNTFSAGKTEVMAGKLVVNGTQPQSTVVVDAGATLAGTGIVGNILGDGTIAPGNSPGILTSSNVTLSSSAALNVDLSGPVPGSGYDQLNVNGTVALGNANLRLNMLFVGSTNSVFTFIANDGTDAVTGTFAGLPEGSTVTASNGAKFLITYQGGTGNDVVLKQISLPTEPRFTSVAKQGDGGIQLTGTGMTNLPYTVWASTNLLTANWLNLGTTTANGVGVLQFTDLAATNYPMRFYRLSWP